MHIKQLLCAASAMLLCSQAMGQVTFYEGEDFHGRAFTTTRAQADFKRSGFNDRAASVIVDSGRWEVCEEGDYRGDCVLLRPGSYRSLRQLGLDNRVSSVRRITDRDSASYGDYYSPEPGAAPVYEYRRRSNEPVFEARVTSVRGVMESPGQRCWIESKEEDGSNGPDTAGAAPRSVFASVLGHQIGSVSGQLVATAGGAQDAQRCETADRIPPDYWEVTYTFRKVTHHVQMSELPGRTIYVNQRGEPRQ